MIQFLVLIRNTWDKMFAEVLLDLIFDRTLLSMIEAFFTVLYSFSEGYLLKRTLSKALVSVDIVWIT